MKKQLLIVFGIIFLLSSKLLAQSVTGEVTDQQTGEALPGVNIVVKGTTIGTSTDSKGMYQLNVPSLSDTLIFSFIGYESQEVAINGRTEIDVSLNSQAVVGEEMVVVGYGTVEERDLTGSVKSVDEERFQDTPYTTIEEGLKGAVAGVQIKNTSGANPGGETSLRIRGYSTINSGGEPLYVIDGYPGVDNINSINPSDIKSIEILKDASATAIYGARGANGVVLITTKKGSAGDTDISLNYSRGIQTVSKRYNLLNATEFARYTNVVNENGGMAPAFDTPSDFGEGTDWQDEIFRSGVKQDLQLSIRGGNEKTIYSLSGEYFTQEGVVIGSGLDRGSFRANITSDVTDKLTASASLQISQTIEDVHDPNVVTAALTISPMLLVKSNDENYLTNADLASRYGQFFFSKGNPVAMGKEVDEVNKERQVIGNGYLEYDFTDNLVFKTSFGANMNFGRYNYYVPDGIPYLYRIESGGFATVNSSESVSWINENTLKYNNSFGIHEIDLTLGTTFQEMNFANVEATAEDFSSDHYKYNNLSLGSTQRPSDTSADSWFLNSYFGRVNYQLFDKYLATFTMRVDGSSKFGKNNKYGYFPSGALAWRLSDEPFFEGLDFLTDLKLRTSYGITGNQEIGSYQSLAGIGGTEYILGDSRVVGAAPVSIANKGLKWEKTSQLDIGLDAGFFNNRLNITADYYYKKTSDLLLQVKVPYSSGFEISLQNIGEVANRGVEFSVSSTNILTEDFSWSTNFNLTLNRNEVLDLGETDEIISNGFLWFFGSHSITREGQPIGMFYTYEFDGIWQTDDDISNSHQPGAQPGDPRFVDQNEDGQINAQDRAIVGSPHPDFLFGFSTNLNWKNFELTAQIDGSYGNKIMNESYIDVMFPNATTNTTHDTFYNRWTLENRSNTHLRAGSNIPATTSSKYLEDASYLRINTLTFGYNLPQNLLNKIGASNVKLYVSAQNLYTLTNYSGFNPESNFFGDDNLRLGFDYKQYPQARTINVGINLNF